MLGCVFLVLFGSVEGGISGWRERGECGSGFRGVGSALESSGRLWWWFFSGWWTRFTGCSSLFDVFFF